MTDYTQKPVLKQKWTDQEKVAAKAFLEQQGDNAPMTDEFMYCIRAALIAAGNHVDIITNQW
jgi:hypothetical protein